MAIGLDANCFAEAQGLRDRCAAPGSGSRSRERWGVPWKGKAWNTRPRPAMAEAARTAQQPGLILAAFDAVGTLGGCTPLPWHAPPRLCGEPSADADRQGRGSGPAGVGGSPGWLSLAVLTRSLLYEACPRGPDSRAESQNHQAVGDWFIPPTLEGPSAVL